MERDEATEKGGGQMLGTQTPCHRALALIQVMMDKHGTVLSRKMMRLDMPLRQFTLVSMQGLV